MSPLKQIGLLPMDNPDVITILGEIESVTGLIGELEAKLHIALMQELTDAGTTLRSLQESINASIVGPMADAHAVLTDSQATIQQSVTNQAAGVYENAGLDIGNYTSAGFSVEPLATPAGGQLSPDQKAAVTFPGDYCPADSQCPTTTQTPTQPQLTPSMPPGTTQPPTTTPAPIPTPQPQPAGPSSHAHAAVSLGCDVDRYAKDKIQPAAFTGSQQASLGSILGEALGWVASIATGGSAASTIATAIFAALQKFISDSIGKADETVRADLAASGCTSDGLGQVISADILYGFLQKYFIPEIPQLRFPLEYSRNALCPVEFPGHTEAIDAFLSDAISFDTLQTWLAQNDKCVEPMLRVMEARRSKPAALDLIQLRLRKQLTESDYHIAMRKLGYTKEDDRNKLFALSQEIPPVSELVRYMVRDVADEAVVKHFNFDALFEQKNIGFLKEWFESQGVPEQFQRAAWRAHWILPSPGQLYTMYQRLRKLPDADPRKTTLADVEQALRHNDVLPFWIPKLLAVSFNPIGRRDIQRGVNSGVMTERDVTEAFEQLGYSDDNAIKLARFFFADRNNKIGSNAIIRSWRQEQIDRADAQRKLLNQGYPLDVVEPALQAAEIQQSNNSAVVRFKRFIITREQAARALDNHGIVHSTYDQWLDDAAQAYKRHPDVLLFKAGALTKQETITRLMGYGIAHDIASGWLDDITRGFVKHDALTDYANGEIDRAAAENLMSADGMPATSIRRLLDKVERKIKAGSRMRCAKALVTRFERGEFSADRLAELLRKQGWPAVHVDNLVSAAQCERDAQGKDPATAQLCEWLELGLIETIAFVQRLENLGWSNDDAVRILTTCLSKISAKRAQQAAAEAKREAQASEQSRRQLERMQNALAKQQADAIKKSELAKSAIARRDAALVKAADKLRTLDTIDLADAHGMVKAEKQRVQHDYALTVDDAIAVVVRAVEGRAAGTDQTFTDRVTEVADAWVDLAKVSAASNGSAS